jgi:hypothetical protein
MVAWDQVSRADVLPAIREYDRLGPDAFFSKHGFAPTTTYDLVLDKRRYPPKAILGTAYELATGERLGSGDSSRAGSPAPSPHWESWDSRSDHGDEPGRASVHRADRTAAVRGYRRVGAG